MLEYLLSLLQSTNVTIVLHIIIPKRKLSDRNHGLFFRFQNSAALFLFALSSFQ